MAQNLTTNIIINAKTGSGFSKVGATLTEMGSIVNGISQQLINFGEDSVRVYREYELSMRDAEVALSTTYGRGTQQLQTVMTQLDTSATNWASTTIFHTNDVANAISEAAHAGWDLDQIMSGLPAAMQLAQAGGLDLSESVNYIVKSTYAAGIGFEDLGNFIDLWAFAANSSASTIGEYGDAMLRMGSTMRFAANPEELMTLIAVTANAGATGSEAGTMIRNSIMRLVAPTQKAEEAMAELGATSIETAGLMEDEALAAANATLAAYGFSVYDEKGNLRNVLDIYHDLYYALGDIAGGFDNLDRNQDALSILSAIFPTRTITEALTLLRAASDEYGGLYDAMMGGAAEGYGAYASETMMDTLNGNIMTYESKVERLKQLVGEELKPTVESAAEFAGGIVDSLAEMDPAAFSALVDGLTVVAAAGPALLIAGAAFRLIGLAMTPIGGAALGLTALAAAAYALKGLNDSRFADNFGNMELDTTAILEYIGSLGEGFKAAYSEVDSFTEAMNSAVQSYQSASSAFSGTLLTDMLTNTKLTDADKTKLTQLGNDMYAAVQEAIANSAAASMSYWQALFGGDGTAEYDPAYQQIIELTNQAYEDAMAQAEGISQGLRDAMTSAFADGEISGEEYRQILSYMRSYNDAIARATAEAQSEEDYIKMQKWLHQAQTASLEDIQTLAKGAAEERDAILAEQEDRYLTERYRTEYRWKQAIENGEYINGVLATEEGMKSALSHTDDLFDQEQLQTQAAYDEFLTTLWSSQIQQSGQADNYTWLAGVADMYLGGQITGDSALSLITEQLGKSIYAGQSGFGAANSDRAQLGKMLGFWLDSMGGEAALGERNSYYQSIGQNDMAEQLYRMYAMEQLANGFEQIFSTGRPSWDLLGLTGGFTTTGPNEHIMREWNRSAAESVFEGYAAQYASDYSVEAARMTVETLGGKNGTLGHFFDLVGTYMQEDTVGARNEVLAAWNGMSRTASEEMSSLMQQLASAYDFSAVIRDYGASMPDGWGEGNTADIFASWQLLYGQASENAESYRIPISGDFTEVSEQLGELNGEEITTIVNADTDPAAQAIAALNGTTVSVSVVAGSTSLTGGGFRGRGGKFAEGGRATEASIFGEAGPEWAIPEEHSERTAALLNAARAASGFTWPDLLARFGGLNANANNQPSTVIYSPVVHAADASGVDAVLREDKKRLEKWWEERKMRDAMEVYA